jgi:hypothetical protein
LKDNKRFNNNTGLKGRDIKSVVDDEIVIKKKDDEGEFIEIDYKKLKPDTNYVVIYDNQLYGVSKISDDKFEFFEVTDIDKISL